MENFSQYTSRKLTVRQLSEWSQDGLAYHQELVSILNKIKEEINVSRSPSKVINKAIKNLEGFFARKGVRGSINERNNRNIEFYLNYPQKIDSGLSFCIVEGHINGRSGLITISDSKPILISFHALQRLFERMPAENESFVLDEIYSSIRWAPAWNIAAKHINAQCWPILSQNGFFTHIFNKSMEII